MVFLAIAKQIENAFAALGLEEIGKVGEKFDPAMHEAFAQDAAESAETDDTITAILEKGWKIGDVVIRPAKVRVAHFGRDSNPKKIALRPLGQVLLLLLRASSRSVK